MVRYTPRQETLHIKTLSAKLLGVRTDGKYLIVKLNIKNNLTRPATFAHGPTTQTFLVAGGAELQEAFNAERNDPNSFVTNNEPIQPGGSKTADVIFAVSPQVASRVMSEQDGGLFIGNFGDDLSTHLRSGVGLIALKTH
jgi:hypothetical protein